MAENSVHVPHIRLDDAVEIPQIGFGTFKIPPEDTQRAVENALELGYRHIDTAAAYYNEAGVGAALRATGFPRDQVFVTTKLRNADQGREAALDAFDASRRALGIEVPDLYLIHWPDPAKGLYTETWQALVELSQAGAVRAIGVSNFLPEHLDRIIEATGVIPAVDQVEIHPTFSQPEVRQACARLGIVVEAYSPLGQGRDLEDPVVTGIAQRLDVTPAQVVLAWHIAQGRVVIPKSVHPDRMRTNLEAASLRLEEADIAAVTGMHDAGGRLGGDPATFDYPQTREDAAARNESHD